ncbi:MAG: hypothetical protein OEW11_04475 [Nitrospirota bacterium]|nr:hypothetical protein [Nitrospirota bacterium]
MTHTPGGSDRIPPIFRPAPMAIAMQTGIGVVWGAVLIVLILKFMPLPFLLPFRAWVDGGGRLILVAGFPISQTLLFLGGLLLPIVVYPPIAHLLVARRFVRGMWRMYCLDYRGALPELIASGDFFVRHPWLDRHRAWILLSLSRYSLREMSLLCVAHCHLRLGEREAALDAYRHIADTYPHNLIARDALFLGGGN